MTKKLFRSMFLVALTVLLSSLILVLSVLFHYFRGVQRDQLRSQLNLAATAVEMGGISYLEQLEINDCRLTWVGTNGTVLYDSHRDAGTLGNHINREEIQKALKTGVGESSRFSETLTEETLYSAKRLSDGTILRASIGFATVPSLLLGILTPVVLVFLVALILSIFVAKRLCGKIVKPLNDINLDAPLENETYDELSPLLTRMDKQQQKISDQRRALNEKQAEFYAVIENMEEGLVLLNKGGTVLSINPAASDFFQVSHAVGKDLIETERTPELGKAVEQATLHGSQTLSVSRNGHEYQLNINRIQSKETILGVVILIFDVTDKVFAERNRREFTANVSHELKTPLHSIMGSAELLEHGLVKPEDVPRFIQRIHTEASRLVLLIEDIIHLSQLDENAEPEAESLDFMALVSESISLLTPQAERKNISVSLEGQSAMMTGVRQLLQEIVYNLCDNAIKYNVEGGSLHITVTATEGEVVLRVSDTGIGIPLEHQDRIFERFYRVDKSRSKETGGTGLGLSIVKHAVQYMNGTIHLDSTPGSGTTITIRFPR